MFKIAEPGVIVSLLNDSVKPTIFLGAGASKQSGIKLVVEIVEEIAKWAYCDQHGFKLDDPRVTLSDWTKWLKQFSWYNENYSELYPIIIDQLLNPTQKRRNFFLKLITSEIPASRGYEVLCELISLELVDTILTGNFDNCLHVAQSQLRRPSFIQSIKTPSDLTTFSSAPRNGQLVYLHGSVEHYTDQNIISEIQNLDEELVSTIKPILKDHPLIVIGYRGGEPSVMNDLFLRNLNYTNRFRQGIYWCILRRELDSIKSGDTRLPPLLNELVIKVGTNFQFVPIDGFDELMTREVWGRLQASEIDLKAKPIPVISAKDSNVIAKNTIGSIEMALIRERIRNYSARLNIKIYEEDWWLNQQMVRLKIAEMMEQNSYELTSSGILLFSSKTQHYIPNAHVILRFVGTPEWLNEITSFSTDMDANQEDFSKGFVEKIIQGNLWNQLNEITDSLTLINRPFRLKSEVSENVYPYPTLALKEVIVNSLVHRDYSIEKPVIIEVTKDKLVLKSPGGLIEEVKRQVTDSLEEEIKRGRRGIKGYRNPVLADLFYGAGAMDKEGSGLSDVVKQVTANGSAITFGPTTDEREFHVTIYKRFEEIDEITKTATPLVVKEPSRFAGNLFEVLELPQVIYHAATSLRSNYEINSKRNEAWYAKFILHRERLWSFYNPDDPKSNLHQFIEEGTIEEMAIDEFVSMNQGTRELVQMLNDCLVDHLFSIGLRVDVVKKRAYFTKNFDGTPKEISYQGRLKKATRTVAKPRTNKVTGKVYYWEHKSVWFSFDQIGTNWYLCLNPSYVFTIDGVKQLLKSERVNILSTKRASRDYNMNIHNDLTFWGNYISQGKDGAFRLRPNNKENNESGTLWKSIPDIVLSTKLPVVLVHDISIGGDYIEPDEVEDVEEVESELERLAEDQLEEKGDGN